MIIRKKVASGRHPHYERHMPLKQDADTMILLENVDTPFGNIKIMRSKSDGATTYYQDKCFHSQATGDGVSTCAYIHMMYNAIVQAKARDVLMIGCAGGTLATMLHRFGCAVTVVDVNDYAFTLARRYFQMQKEVACVAADGWTYLHQATRRYDAIAIDVFDNEGNIPEAFVNADFFRMVKGALTPPGLVVMNVMTAHDLDLQADRIALAMEEARLPTRLYDWPGTKNRNTLVVGGAIGAVQLPAGGEPKAVREDMKGLTCRRAVAAAA